MAKTKLSRIAAALKANERIELLREKSLYCTGSPLGPDDVLRHWQSYLVAPREGIYTLAELNLFAATLFPFLKPNNEIEFKVCSGSVLYLQLGQLRFIEEIGRQKTTITSYIESIDEEFSRQKGFVGDRKKLPEIVNEEQNRRFIDIILCPDRRAVDALELNLPDEGFGLFRYRAIISFNDLSKFVPEFRELYRTECLQRWGYEPT